MQKIIGRKKEIKELQRLYQQQTAELVAVYGRRRVGKTFLVREYFEGKFAFYHTGVSPFEIKGNKLLSRQLEEFHYSLRQYGLKDESCPSSWAEAFHQLQQLLEMKNDGNRIVVFLDELPWMDSPRSGFISAFEHFWNAWGAGQSNLLCIVCGSATSWMNDQLINNKGGLYNRVTYELQISPFNLRECEDFFQYKGISIDRYDIVQCYMAVGGIPYYLNYFKPELSAAQNIDELFFVKNAHLRHEFERLFASLFNRPTEYVNIVRLLSTRRMGFTRMEIAQKTGIATGGTLTKILNALESSEFVIEHTPLNAKGKTYYKLVDNFCLFYLYFIEGKTNIDEHFWQNSIFSPSLSSWRGFAFEEVCFSHIPQIKSALGISGIQTKTSTLILRKEEEEVGTQVDMVIDRADRVINLCEMKFYNQEYSIDKTEEEKLRHRLETMLQHTKNRRNIHLTLITTFGLKYNMYSGRIQQVITLEDLFR